MKKDELVSSPSRGRYMALKQTTKQTIQTCKQTNKSKCLYCWCVGCWAWSKQISDDCECKTYQTRTQARPEHRLEYPPGTLSVKTDPLQYFMKERTPQRCPTDANLRRRFGSLADRIDPSLDRKAQPRKPHLGLNDTLWQKDPILRVRTTHKGSTYYTFIYIPA
jgi:hypothetical protein